MMTSVYQSKIVVSSEDIDDLNHVNNAVYVKWMDDVAFNHWAELTKNNPLSQYIWVVVKHEINYLKQAGLGDEIKIKTWIDETNGITSIRLIEFYKEDVLIVKAKTTWAMLSAQSYKPVRIRENVLKVLQASK